MAGCASETDIEDTPLPLLSQIGEERRAFADEVSGPSHGDGMSHIHQPMMISELTAQDRVCLSHSPVAVGQNGYHGDYHYVR